MNPSLSSCVAGCGELECTKNRTLILPITNTACILTIGAGDALIAFSVLRFRVDGAVDTGIPLGRFRTHLDYTMR